MLNNIDPVGHYEWMNTQNQIKRTLSQPGNLAYVSELLDSKQFKHRTELAGLLCRQFRFYDARDKKHLGGSPEWTAFGCVKCPVRGPAQQITGGQEAHLQHPDRRKENLLLD